MAGRSPFPSPLPSSPRKVRYTMTAKQVQISFWVLCAIYGFAVGRLLGSSPYTAPVIVVGVIGLSLLSSWLQERVKGRE